MSMIDDTSSVDIAIHCRGRSLRSTVVLVEMAPKSARLRGENGGEGKKRRMGIMGREACGGCKFGLGHLSGLLSER